MNEPTGITARMWLLMAKEGGLWTASELARQMEYDRVSATQNLSSMARGHSVRKQKVGPAVKYSVTSLCLIPRGVSLKEILECNLHQMNQ